MNIRAKNSDKYSLLNACDSRNDRVKRRRYSTCWLAPTLMYLEVNYVEE